MNPKPIYVTKAFLPPLEEYEEYLKKIWHSGQITNNGPHLIDFENATKQFLAVDQIQIVTNGTLAIQLALKALGIESGDIITTPFTYVATVSSVLWERCTPVFVDIDSETLCIDANKIEESITPDTKAILAVHVYGNACDVEKIEEIAHKHGLKVIYDAAHAFGAELKGRSLLDYGDVSTCSFHATKLFSSVEGGAVIAKSKAVDDKLELLKRFGHNGDEHIMLGINAKISELHAAMGLCNLKYIDQLLKKREEVYLTYKKKLTDKVRICLSVDKQKHNYAYIPIVFNNNSTLNEAITRLNERQIFPRRYFFPSLNKLPYINTEQACPVSEDIASRVLCLPTFHDITDETIQEITDVVNEIADKNL